MSRVGTRYTNRISFRFLEDKQVGLKSNGPLPGIEKSNLSGWTGHSTSKWELIQAELGVLITSPTERSNQSQIGMVHRSSLLSPVSVDTSREHTKEPFLIRLTVSSFSIQFYIFVPFWVWLGVISPPSPLPRTIHLSISCGFYWSHVSCGGVLIGVFHFIDSNRTE